MLSRIARGLYHMGRLVERAQGVARILEVNHKMHLERAPLDVQGTWAAIFGAYGLSAEEPTEEALYERLVLDPDFPYSVRFCITAAREEGRTKREHISEELWSHLNQFHLRLRGVDFPSIARSGRSAFNARIGRYCHVFQGMAHDTLVHGAEWHFLRLGRFLERAFTVLRVLEIKRKALLLEPEQRDRPLDLLQWQALLRSVGGYEPYRRVYDARIRPGRVLEFVLQSRDFPHSLCFSLHEVTASLAALDGGGGAHAELRQRAEQTLVDLMDLDAALLLQDGLEGHLQRLGRRCHDLADAIEQVCFSGLPISAAPPFRPGEYGPVAQ